MDSTKHNTASEDSTAHGEDRHESEKWKATRLIDERTGDSCIGFHFPTWQHGPRFEVIDEDLAEQPGKVRERLKKRGAAFEGTKDAQIAFTHQLLKERLPEPLTLAMKPGLRKPNGFVLGNKMLGTVEGSFLWNRHADCDIGDHCGSRAAWNNDVGKVAADSTYLTFALCVALGAPLPTYVLDRCQKRLVSETAVFNFSGGSGSGKSSINRPAAGTFGPPQLGKWDFTRRGLEESAEERNDLTVILDDTESHNEEHLSFKSALRYVNQIVTSGQSKTISKVAREARLPFLTWTAWGLTSSPKSLEEIAEEIGWNRTNGERVRFIDIPVPPVSEGGIFDWLEGDELQRIKQSKQLIDQLDKGVTGNYGGIFPLWIKFLLSTNCAEQVCRLTEQFVTRVHLLMGMTSGLQRSSPCLRLRVIWPQSTVSSHGQKCGPSRLQSVAIIWRSKPFARTRTLLEKKYNSLQSLPPIPIASFRQSRVQARRFGLTTTRLEYGRPISAKRFWRLGIKLSALLQGALKFQLL